MQKTVIHNKKGMTLVETIIGVCLLGIASVMLVKGFTSTAAIVNRAILYKNASAAASSAIELHEVDPSLNNSVVKVQLSDVLAPDTNNPEEGLPPLTISGTRSTGEEVTVEIPGVYVRTTDDGTKLNYREFSPDTFDYLPVEEVDDGD